MSLTTVNAGFSASGLESRNALCIRGSAGELQGHCHAGLFPGPTVSWPRRGGRGDFSDAVTARARPVACWEWGTTGAVTGGRTALPAGCAANQGEKGRSTQALQPGSVRSRLQDYRPQASCELLPDFQGQIRLWTQARATSTHPPAMHCSPRSLPLRTLPTSGQLSPFEGRQCARCHAGDYTSFQLRDQRPASPPSPSPLTMARCRRAGRVRDRVTPGLKKTRDRCSPGPSSGRWARGTHPSYTCF